MRFQRIFVIPKSRDWDFAGIAISTGMDRLIGVRQQLAVMPG